MQEHLLERSNNREASIDGRNRLGEGAAELTWLPSRLDLKSAWAASALEDGPPSQAAKHFRERTLQEMCESGDVEERPSSYGPHLLF
jgi:hypothetical protein